MARTPPPGASAAARQATIRDTNLRLGLSTVLGSPEPVSRAGVAIATALTRSTVSRLADELVAAGLVDELAPRRGAAGGAGGGGGGGGGGARHWRRGARWPLSACRSTRGSALCEWSTSAA